MKSYGYLLLLISAVCHAASPTDEIIEAARLVAPIQIVYPQKAQRHEEEGTVVLKLLVLADGNTGETIIFKSSGYPLLDSAALESTVGLRFSPAKNRSGLPMESSVFIPVRFELLPGKSK